jgi:catalase
MMTLDRNVDNFFAENEQVAFGTGVLVDGLDFSDDKMLVGRTFSYSDTQRYRVGPNYLQLPINQPLERPATNQRDGQMAYYVDTVGQNPHVNYEPNSLGGLVEDPGSGPEHRPHVEGPSDGSTSAGRNDYAQAGERYRTMPEWEREDLVLNMIDLLGQCERHIQERMVGAPRQCDTDYGTARGRRAGTQRP